MLKICSEILVGLHTKCAIYLSDFNQNWNVLANLVNPSIPNLMKIPSGAATATIMKKEEFGHTDEEAVFSLIIILCT
jgi:hypothetical protein